MESNFEWEASSSNKVCSSFGDCKLFLAALFLIHFFLERQDKWVHACSTRKRNFLPRMATTINSKFFIRSMEIDNNVYVRESLDDMVSISTVSGLTRVFFLKNSTDCSD